MSVFVHIINIVIMPVINQETDVIRVTSIMDFVNSSLLMIWLKVFTVIEPLNPAKVMVRICHNNVIKVN